MGQTLSCVEDFTQYLLYPDIRTRVLQCFHDVVDPLLGSGRPVSVISHSWGTVIAYEALRQRDDRAGENGPARSRPSSLSAAPSASGR
jgi:hypothetical protein